MAEGVGKRCKTLAGCCQAAGISSECFILVCRRVINQLSVKWRGGILPEAMDDGSPR